MTFKPTSDTYDAIDGAYYRVIYLLRPKCAVARHAGASMKTGEPPMRYIGTYDTSQEAHRIAERLAAQERGS